jgi:predicted phosphodiesterase
MLTERKDEKKRPMLSVIRRFLPALLVAITIGAVTLQLFAQTTVRFVVMSDSHVPSGNATVLSEIVQETINRNANFILVSGDLTDDGTQAHLTQWRNAVQPLYDNGIAVYPIRGNHDAGGTKTAWDNVFTGTYALPGNGPSGETNITYSFTYGNVFVVGLDEYVTSHRVNQTWLTAQLNSNTQPHVFVFGHEPAFKVYHSDCLDDYPSDRNTLWNGIKAGGGHVYFCGHDHIYDHARIGDGDGNTSNDLHQYIVSTSGGTLRNSGTYNGNNAPFTPTEICRDYKYGYLLVEVNGMVETLTWMARTGTGTYTQSDTQVFGVRISARVFLQGPYSSMIGLMSTNLNSSGSLPTSQPYNVSPRNYSGSESVASGFFASHTDIVDWILVELRSGTDAGSKDATRACFLKSDGSVVDLDGTSQVTSGVSAGSYYIVVCHRNHLAIMSANAVSLTASSSLYDFTTAQTQAYGTNPMQDLGSGKFGMFGGDGNGDGGVYAEDYTLYRTRQGNEGYDAADYNLDGGVYAEDYTLRRINQGKETGVP